MALFFFFPLGGAHLAYLAMSGSESEAEVTGMVGVAVPARYVAPATASRCLKTIL